METKDGFLTGFLFGNVNEKGELELDEEWDEELKGSLSRLSNVVRRHKGTLDVFGGQGISVPEIPSTSESEQSIQKGLFPYISNRKNLIKFSELFGPHGWGFVPKRRYDTTKFHEIPPIWLDECPTESSYEEDEVDLFKSLSIPIDSRDVLAPLQRARLKVNPEHFSCGPATWSTHCSESAVSIEWKSLGSMDLFHPLILDEWEKRICWDDPPHPKDEHLPRIHVPSATDETFWALWNPPVENFDWLSQIIWDDPRIPSNDYRFPLSPNHLSTREASPFSFSDHVHSFGDPSSILALEADVSSRLRDLAALDHYCSSIEQRPEKVTYLRGKLAIEHTVFAYRLQRPSFRTFFTKTEIRLHHRPRLLFPFNVDLPLNAVHPREKDQDHPKDSTRVHSSARSTHPLHVHAMGTRRVPKRLKELCLHDEADFTLFEYSEEFPPLLMNFGMTTAIHNYYRRMHDVDDKTPQHEHGIPVSLGPSEESPFMNFGNVRSGQTIQALVNNLFIAPIFPQPMESTDFLVIRYKNKWLVREIPSCFVVGQEFPLMEVPAPGSRRAMSIFRTRLETFIYRLFKKQRRRRSDPVIRVTEVTRAFPTYSELSIRRTLKNISDAHRMGHRSVWRLHRHARIPREDELRTMVTPEMICTYESMLMGLQRLKDGGHIDSLALMREISMEEEAGDENMDSLDTESKQRTRSKKSTLEIRLAPWNVTHAFRAATLGKVVLDLTGPGDPTGCGEGYSFTIESSKTSAIALANTFANASKELASMTDADVRRVDPEAAKRLLVRLCVNESELMGQGRWDLVSRLRGMQSKAQQAVESGKFSRTPKSVSQEQQQRFREAALRIWNSQLSSLGSIAKLGEETLHRKEKPSSLHASTLGKSSLPGSHDHDSSEDEWEQFRQLWDEEWEEKAETESKTSPKRISTLPLDDDARSLGSMDSRSVSRMSATAASVGIVRASRKVLRIERLVVLPNGEQSWRTEIVRDPDVISLYLRKQERGGSHLPRKTSRPLLSRYGQSSPQDPSTEKGEWMDTEMNQDLQKDPFWKGKGTSKCSACGKIGHKRSNRHCPAYTFQKEDHTSLDPSIAGMFENGLLDVLMAEGGESEIPLDPDQTLKNRRELVKIEGTKISFSKAMLEKALQRQRDSLETASTPTEMSTMEDDQSIEASSRGGAGGKRRRQDHLEENAGLPSECLALHQQFRRRKNPEAVLSMFLEKLWNRLRNLPQAWPFMKSVSTKYAPDYYKVIKTPKDLGTIHEHIKQMRYLSTFAFLEDIRIMKENCQMYNGPLHPFTKTAEDIYRIAEQGVHEFEEEVALSDAESVHPEKDSLKPEPDLGRENEEMDKEMEDSYQSLLPSHSSLENTPFSSDGPFLTENSQNDPRVSDHNGTLLVHPFEHM